MCCVEYGEETQARYLATDFSWPLDYWLLTVELIFINDQQIKFTARRSLLKNCFFQRLFIDLQDMSVRLFSAARCSARCHTFARNATTLVDTSGRAAT